VTGASATRRRPVLAIASSQGIDTDAWISAAALREAAGVYAGMTLWVTGWGILVRPRAFRRSVPIALGIGMARAGPVEGLLGDSWGPSPEWFPGLLLASFTVDDPAVSTGRALFTLGAYCVAGLTVTGTVLAQRDVTS